MLLYTIAVVLLIHWLLGLLMSTTMGGFVHLLLVIAAVVVVLQLLSGRRELQTRRVHAARRRTGA